MFQVIAHVSRNTVAPVIKKEYSDEFSEWQLAVDFASAKAQGLADNVQSTFGVDVRFNDTSHFSDGSDDVKGCFKVVALDAQRIPAMLIGEFVLVDRSRCECPENESHGGQCDRFGTVRNSACHCH